MPWDIADDRHSLFWYILQQFPAISFCQACQFHAERVLYPRQTFYPFGLPYAVHCFPVACWHGGREGNPPAAISCLGLHCSSARARQGLSSQLAIGFLHGSGVLRSCQNCLMRSPRDRGEDGTISSACELIETLLHGTDGTEQSRVFPSIHELRGSFRIKNSKDK